MKSNNQFLVF